MSVWGNPVLLGVGPNLCPPLVVGEDIDTTTGEWSQPGGTTTMASDYYIPVDFNANPKYTLSYYHSNSTVRSMVYAYNANHEFLGRIGGTQTRRRTFTSEDFTYGTPAGTGDPAYVRVRLYNGTFSATDDYRVQVEAGDTATTYRARSLEYIS